MKKLLIYILVLIFILGTLPHATADSYTYNDGYTKIGNTVIPFPEYMPGTYFTKNGQPCTCHDNASINCVASGPYCNCLRFVSVDGKELDLLAVQCIGFARYCFYRLFGFIDYDMNSSLFYNAGTLSYGQVNEGTVKTLIGSLKPGAHIRFKLAYTEHSVILLSQNSEGFTVYQCNSGGNGIATEDCIVSTKTYTWESFATYAYRGITFAHMPNNYPTNLEYSDTPFIETVYTAGKYTLTANLRLRAGNSTDSEWLDTIPLGTVVEVTEVIENWGLTEYNGQNGWICLDYASFLGETGILIPKANSGIYIKDSYIYGIDYGCIGSLLAASFENQNIVISCGNEDLVGTGVTVIIMENDEAVYTATVVMQGDTNGDGILSTADCMLIKAHLSNASLLSDAFLLAADVNRNGFYSGADYKMAIMLLEQSAQP